MGYPASAKDCQTDHAAVLLQAGGVVAFPTETVYGLGADAENAEAVRRIFSIKRRPADHPLIVHLADLALLDRWARDIPESALRLAEQFWPGPLTIVLRRNPRVSDLVTGGLDTVGIRIPAHPVARDLLRAFGGGIAAPSANRFGHISPTRADHVREELGYGPDLILDGGDCQVGLESTIISLAGEHPVLLRPGAISLRELRDAVGDEIRIPEKPDRAMRAPGCHASHYAPRTPAVIVSPVKLPAVVRRLGAGKKTIAMLCSSDSARIPSTKCVQMPSDPAGYARILYATLRRLDVAGCDMILIEAPPDTEPWLAIRDRIQRAAHQHSAKTN